MTTDPIYELRNRIADCDHGSEDADVPLLTDEPGKITKLTGPDSVAEAIRAHGPYAAHHRHDAGYADGLAPCDDDMCILSECNGTQHVDATGATFYERVSLDELAAELGITQSTVPWQPLPPVDVLKGFDQTIAPGAVDVSADHAATIRDAWAGEQ